MSKKSNFILFFQLSIFLPDGILELLDDLTTILQSKAF
jgi:hypothetical protein